MLNGSTLAATEERLLEPGTQANGLRTSRQHIPALDGIRGIAIAMVLAHHLPNQLPIYSHVTNHGWAGVDLFFVLSGFLITGILFDSRNDKHYFRNFYARRTLRIFPLYYGVIGAYTIFYLWHRQMNLARELGWFWSYLTNFHIALRPQGELDLPLAHFWSLAVEEHFYLVWPAIVLWLDRKSLMRLCVCLMIVALAMRGGIALWGNYRAAYLLTPCRMDGLAAGSWLSLAVRGSAGLEAFRRVGLFVFASSAATLFALHPATNGLSRANPVVYTVGFSLIAAGSTGLIAAAVANPLGWLCRLVSISPLRWLGKYSYALYVLHPLVFGLPIVVRGWSSRFQFVPEIVASLLAAWLSYHLYEKHFLKLKRFFED
jgi:peptidoglycan/LPS O-acetylase OafA/YrhL